MDKIEKLRELYDSIIEKIEPLQIAMIVLNDIKDIEKFKDRKKTRLNSSH